MSSTIDIDIGGTFTDCVLLRDGTLTRWKSPTTAYDLSLGVRDAIRGCAEQDGRTYEQLLQQLDIIRYSTTIAMNALLEHKGPKLGVITTAGNEHMLQIGRSRQWADGLHQREVRNLARIRKPQPLVPHEMVVGVRERIDWSGKIICPLDAEDVAVKVRQLVDLGAQGFVVVLLWSHVNPNHEHEVKRIITDLYPDIHLGGLPVYCSAEVAPTWHEYPRANTTILNAYLHAALQDELSALGFELKSQGYKKPLMVVNNIGGAAKVTRTRALDTWSAGPVAGLFGSSYLASLYGLENVVVTDMGGTSFDFGLVSDGEVRYYNDQPIVDRWLTETSMIEVKTIGAGGGSVAWLNPDLQNRLEVGPQSSGANPGPACYAQGGRLPTVTDADLVLGFLDPDYFLGGRIRLDLELAKRAIRRHVADPLGIDVVEGAAAIRRSIDSRMGDVIAKELFLRGLDIRDFVLFAYGGAGPLHCTDYVRALDPTMDCYTFLYSSVFCALGAATMDLRHVYTRSHHIALCDLASDHWLEDPSDFNQAVELLRKDAIRDIRSEGLDADRTTYVLELDMRYRDQTHLTRVRSPFVTIDDPQDVKLLVTAFETEYARRYSGISLDENGALEIESFHLVAAVEHPKPQLPTIDRGGPNATAAKMGERRVFWPDMKTWTETPIFDATGLRSRNVVAGPAIVQAPDTTVLVPHDRIMTVDELGTAVLRHI